MKRDTFLTKPVFRTGILVALLFLLGTPTYGNVTLNPNSVTFGQQALAMASAPRQVTLTNNSRSTVHIVRVSSSLGQFSYSGPLVPVTLKPGQSMTGSVTFTPTAARTYRGTLTFIKANGSHTSLVVSGIGIHDPPVDPPPGNPSPSLSLLANTTSVSFGDVNEGSSSAKSIILTNNGTSNVTISGVSNPGVGFSASSITPGTTLVPTQSVTLNITFVPAASGTIRSSVNVSSSAPPVAISITGIGVAPFPNLVLSTSSLNFGTEAVNLASSPISVVLTNSGSGILQVTGISTSLSQFSVSGSTTPFTLASGGTATIQTTFRPTQATAYNGTLTIASNASSSPNVVALSGTGSISASSSTYNARTDLNNQPYPSTIPCPGASCTGGGALVGANTIVTPTDFGNPVVRVTDSKTNPGVSDHQSFSVACSGSAEFNFMDSTETRFSLCDDSDNAVIFSWNAATMQAAVLYTVTANQLGNIYFSYTQPYTGYDLEMDGSDLAIYSYDFESAATLPSRQLVVDLATCVPALAGKSFQWANDVTVSADDQTFAVPVSVSGGQGSNGAIYMIVWSRTNGCRVWNTKTGAVSGSWGTSGATGIPAFTLHNSRILKSGDWVRVDCQNCKANAYFWNIATTTVTTPTDSTECGHQVSGFTLTANPCDSNSGLPEEWWSRTPTNPDSPTEVTPGPACASGETWDQHASWSNDATTLDSTPFLTSSYTNQFAPVCAWDNEIFAVAMDGSGTVWRFGHTFASTSQASGFSASEAIGSVSQGGDWFAWVTDWDGLLGNTNLTSASCSISSNCRADVFIIKLPLSTAPPTLGP